jgi:DNA repair protein RadC
MSAPAPITNPKQAYEHLLPYFAGVEVEHFVVIVLNALNQPIHTECIAKGAVDYCHVDVRSVFCPAIRQLGTSLFIAHNHPSGNPLPSVSDLELTKRLVEAGKLLGVSVLDHIIMATGKNADGVAYISLAEQGLIGK